MKYLIIAPVVLLAAFAALYVWALHQPNIFANMDEAYN